MPSNNASRSQIDSSRKTKLFSKSEQVVRVLMIEDDPYYFRFIHQLLVNHIHPKFELINAENFFEASQFLTWEKPDVILLDLHLPDSSGLETLVRAKDLTGGAPIIILTSDDDENFGLETVALGAQDYLVKQHLSNGSLIRCLRYAIERRKFEESAFRLAAIQDFTNTLAHDLKVPLIGSNNVFEALLSGQFGVLSQEQKHVLSELKYSNHEQLLLVQKLLEIYRYETSKLNRQFKNIDMGTLILRCLSKMDSIEERFIKVKAILPANLPIILGNEEALSQLVINLIDNAIKFGDRTQQIEIRVEVLVKQLAIHVHNFGPAIPEEVQIELFQKFWHGLPGKKYVDRTGLGLYLCHRITSLHNGKITCHSTQEDGTLITACLPSTT